MTAILIGALAVFSGGAAVDYLDKNMMRMPVSVGVLLLLSACVFLAGGIVAIIAGTAAL